MIKVLYIGLKNDYGDPRRGLSFEYKNFFDTLSHMSDVSASEFAFDEVMREVGRKKMNELLVQRIKDERPDMAFFVLFTDEIDQRTIRRITDSGLTKTVNWFCDDHWRFEIFSKYYAPCFHWVATTDHAAVQKYHRINYKNVIKTQWACNHFQYKHQQGPYEYDVSFVGQTHSLRSRHIQTLVARGITVDCWGKGWPRGRISDEGMLGVFSRSKINLNFVESSTEFGAKPLIKIFLNRRADDTIQLRRTGEVLRNLRHFSFVHRPQIKGRNFEIPCTGGFLLTAYADGLEEYYKPDQEVGVFRSPDELDEKIRYFLTHDAEREQVRVAGYERTLREHTFEKRFQDIFQIVGVGNA